MWGTRDPETNSELAPEIRLFPFGMAYFQGQAVSFRECTLGVFHTLTNSYNWIIALM